VTATSAGDNALRFQVTGSIRPLIRELADKPIVSLTSRAPSLEEIFLRHYSSSNGDAGS
jgi:ABC-2 type transport system ATP-binding protein